jgi:hypothetical protein
VAINCWLVPGATETLAGVTAMEAKAGATVTLKEPLTALIFAVMEQAPLALAVSIPPPATVATFVADELQVAELVRSLVVPSL